jgi:hypothetical protein
MAQSMEHSNAASAAPPSGNVLAAAYARMHENIAASGRNPTSVLAGFALACGQEGSLDVLGGLYARRAERLGREPHKPLIELINRGRDVGLPEMRLVGIDASRLHESRRSRVFGVRVEFKVGRIPALPPVGFLQTLASVQFRFGAVKTRARDSNTGACEKRQQATASASTTKASMARRSLPTEKSGPNMTCGPSACFRRSTP